MHRALPFVLLTAALGVAAPDGRPIVRANENPFGRSMTPSLSSTMRRRRGRPRTFAAPSRDITSHRRHTIVLGSNGAKGRAVR